MQTQATGQNEDQQRNRVAGCFPRTTPGLSGRQFHMVKYIAEMIDYDRVCPFAKNPPSTDCCANRGPLPVASVLPLRPILILKHQ